MPLSVALLARGWRRPFESCHDSGGRGGQGVDYRQKHHNRPGSFTLTWVMPTPLHQPQRRGPPDALPHGWPEPWCLTPGLWLSGPSPEAT